MVIMETLRTLSAVIFIDKNLANASDIWYLNILSGTIIMCAFCHSRGGEDDLGYNRYDEYDVPFHEKPDKTAKKYVRKGD